MATLPMPDEFRLFRFDTAGRQDTQFNRVLEWVVHKNGVYNMIEMAAMKRPFATGIGAGSNNNNAVGKSIDRMISALEQLPAVVSTAAYQHVDSLFQLWAKTGSFQGTARPVIFDDTGAPKGGANDGRFFVYSDDRLDEEDDESIGDLGFTGSKEDAKLTFRLAPEGRLSMVVQAIENAYSMVMARVAASHPIIALFDPYIVTGQEGKAGTSIGLAQKKE